VGKTPGAGGWARPEFGRAGFVVAACARRRVSGGKARRAWGGDGGLVWGGRRLGGGYHFRRQQYSHGAVCAPLGLQSGKACRVTRVGSRKPACLLILGRRRPLK
jgi:hypothetical protein